MNMISTMVSTMLSYLSVAEILVFLLTPVAVVVGTFVLFKVGALGPDPEPTPGV
ncbi:MAG TPA: hypothetical protein VM533_02905 [Fimbriiglobus sp.]|jgi:hypothetical protein|nr:hypothetical protein [Fimbriiglobus sp.]